MSYNQYQSQDQSLKRENELTDVSKLPDIKVEQSLGQREMVKQGGLTNTEEDEHHASQGSTMHSLDKLDAHDRTSPEKVSSIHEGMAPGALQHDASEALHKGWEKASDTIAQGVEVVKRIIMSELPPQEGSGLPQGSLMEKAQELSNKASEKIEETKEKIESNLGDVKETAKDSSNQASDKAQEVKDQFKEQGQELKDFSSTGPQQMGGFESETTSSQQWQPTEQMKQKASEKLGEYKEKFNLKAPEFHVSQSQSQQGFSESQPQPSGSGLSDKLGEIKDKAQGQFQEAKQKLESSASEISQPSSSKGESEAIIKIEKGQEARSSTDKINEIEDLSQQLTQKVEELKKSAHAPTGGATETIIIIQQGGEQGLSTQQSQFSQGSQNLSEKISDKAQDLKEGFKQTFQPSGSEQQSQEFSGQEQQRPKLGKRDEQQWRYQQGESQQQSAPSMTEKISDKAQELKEGLKESFQPSGSEQQSQEFSGQEQERPKLGKRDEQQWRYQQGESQQQSGPSVSDQISNKTQELKEGFRQGFEKGLGHPSSESQGLGDKIKEKVSEVKDSYKQNLQSFSQEGHPHHESEHHLRIEAESFRPSAESKHLVEEQLLHQGGESGQSQDKQQSQETSNTGITSFKPIDEAKNLAKKAVGKMEDLSEQATASFNERLQGEGEGQGEEKPAETHDEFGNLRTGPPPSEMVENITYHPRDIRGYEIEYVPKDEAEHQKSGSQQGQEQSKGSKSDEKEGSQSLTSKIQEGVQGGVEEARGKIENLKETLKGEGSEQQPQEERIPLVDRIQHGIQGVAHTIQTIKGLFKPSHESTEQSAVTHDEFGNLRTGPPPTEMVENITYHPRDIRGYEIEYVPKDQHEGQQAKPQSQSQEGQEQPQESDQHHYEYRRGNYLVEYIEKPHHEGESQEKGQESQKSLPGKASELISQQAEVLKDKYSSLGSKGQSEEKSQEQSKGSLSGKTSELSRIIAQQAEALKDKYSSLGSKGQSEEKSQEPTQESHSEEKQPGFMSRLMGKFTHGKEELQQKEEATTESLQGASQDLSKKAEAVKEKVVSPSSQEEGQSEEKQPGFVSRMIGKFTHGKGESTEETSTEQNQSVLEKIQGKFQGKEKGEEVDKQGFRKVHDGFNETVDELKHEQNQEFIEQVHIASENPFEPLATKQAQTVLAPTSNVELVGGDLKNITSDFKEGDQEMVDFRGEEEGQAQGQKGFMQKMKAGLFSKFGHENKENVESSDK